MTVADPVTEHVAELERALRGPTRTRRSMLAEATAGLRDAADAYRDEGMDGAGAADRAVREFGPVHEIAPQFQEELTARQGRATALLLAVVFPGMLVAWDLLWSSGLAWQPRAVPAIVTVLAHALDVVSVLVALTALGLAAASFSRRVSPRRITVLVGLTGALGALFTGGASLAMNLLAAAETARMALTSPIALSALAGSLAVLTLLVRSAVRTLRVARAG
jgi:hypothetical protein